MTVFPKLFRSFACCLMLTALLFGTQSTLKAQVSVLTQHNDIERTGANLNETTLNVSNVNVNQFGKLFSRFVDSIIWTQPLYLPNVNIPNVGLRNVVYVGTENATMYAFDATNAAATAPLWTANLAPSPYTSGFKGIVGTPVIDPASSTLYVVAKIRQTDGTFILRLHALDVATGRDKTGSPVQIQGSVPGTGTGSVNGVQTFNPAWQRQRPALLLVNGTLYVASGSSNSELPGDIYYGWLFAYNASTLQQTGIWCGAPDGLGATLWNSGQGPASDGSNVYVMTGNGRFSASSGGKDYGDSFVRFATAGGGLSVASYFTPFDERDMERYDQDLGSAGPLLLPGTNLVVGAGKKGKLYVIDRTNMGGHRLDNDSQIVQSFPAFNGHLHGSPITWETPSNGRVIYGWSEEDQLKVWKFANGLFNTTPIQRSTMSAPPGMPGGFLSLSANGNAPGTGVLWAFHPYDGDANLGTVNGILRAFDANDVTRELWNSRQNTTRDDLGKYAKFNYVTVADGKVFVPTFSNKMVVYGLLSAPSKPVAPTGLAAVAGDAKVTLNWNATTNAASYTLKRSTTATGPFAVIAANVTTLNYVDTSVTNGTTYYYVVSASNAAGEGPDSNVASATPQAVTPEPTPTTQGISIDFVGGGVNGNPAPMASTESAGVVPLQNWNQAAGRTGTRSGLVDSRNTSTSASLSWSAYGIYSSTITEAPGNARMMKGYLNTSATSTTTVTVSALPSAYTSAGYDVYFYFDGSNANATRTSNYTLSAATISGTDAPNANFNGTFIQANNSAGNYIRFNGLTTSGFTISATPGASSDPNPRAPINGIQIVPRAATTVAPPTVAITSPVANAALRAITEIKGTVSDNSGAGIDRVVLTLWRTQSNGTTKEYWNGTAWSLSVATLSTTYDSTTGTWTRNTAFPTGTTLKQGTHNVEVEAFDKGGRSSKVQSTLIVDSIAPTITVASPANGSTLESLIEVSGTTVDNSGGSGVVRVSLVILRVSDGKRWSYTAWVDFETGIRTVLDGSNWLCNQSLPSGANLSDGQYTLKGVAYDRAGNAGTMRSNITISRTMATLMALRRSNTMLSSATLHADEDKVQLVFTGPLATASATDKTHYTVQVNGKVMGVEGVAYDPDSKAVLVVLPEGTLRPGDTVQVQWNNLSDLKGGWVAGKTGPLRGS